MFRVFSIFRYLPIYLSYRIPQMCKICFRWLKPATNLYDTDEQVCGACSAKQMRQR